MEQKDKNKKQKPAAKKAKPKQGITKTKQSTGLKKAGIEVKVPEKSCKDDKNCPFHGKLNLRGRQFIGKVVNAKVPTNATIEWRRQYYVPKYERYEKRKTKVHAHNPLCIGAKVGETVKIMEARKMSKTKNFVIIEIIK